MNLYLLLLLVIIGTAYIIVYIIICYYCCLSGNNACASTLYIHQSSHSAILDPPGQSQLTYLECRREQDWYGQLGKATTSVQDLRTLAGTNLANQHTGTNKTN